MPLKLSWNFIKILTNNTKSLVPCMRDFSVI
jgi:hypothetical protein